MLKALINETEVARYVSYTFIQQLCYHAITIKKFSHSLFSHEQFEREFVYHQHVHWMMLNIWQCYRNDKSQHVTLKLFPCNRQQKIHMTFGMIVRSSFYCKCHNNNNKKSN